MPALPHRVDTAEQVLQELHVLVDVLEAVLLARLVGHVRLVLRFLRLDPPDELANFDGQALVGLRAVPVLHLVGGREEDEVALGDHLVAGVNELLAVFASVQSRLLQAFAHRTVDVVQRLAGVAHQVHDLTHAHLVGHAVTQALGHDEEALAEILLGLSDDLRHLVRRHTRRAPFLLAFGEGQYRLGYLVGAQPLVLLAQVIAVEGEHLPGLIPQAVHHLLRGFRADLVISCSVDEERFHAVLEHGLRLLVTARHQLPHLRRARLIALLVHDLGHALGCLIHAQVLLQVGDLLADGVLATEQLLPLLEQHRALLAQVPAALAVGLALQGFVFGGQLVFTLGGDVSGERVDAAVATPERGCRVEAVHRLASASTDVLLGSSALEVVFHPGVRAVAKHAARLRFALGCDVVEHAGQRQHRVLAELALERLAQSWVGDPVGDGLDGAQELLAVVAAARLHTCHLVGGHQLHHLVGDVLARGGHLGAARCGTHLLDLFGEVVEHWASTGVGHGAQLIHRADGLVAVYHLQCARSVVEGQREAPHLACTRCQADSTLLLRPVHAPAGRDVCQLEAQPLYGPGDGGCLVQGLGFGHQDLAHGLSAALRDRLLRLALGWHGVVQSRADLGVLDVQRVHVSLRPPGALAPRGVGTQLLALSVLLAEFILASGPDVFADLEDALAHLDRALADGARAHDAEFAGDGVPSLGGRPELRPLALGCSLLDVQHALICGWAVEPFLRDPLREALGCLVAVGCQLVQDVQRRLAALGVPLPVPLLGGVGVLAVKDVLWGRYAGVGAERQRVARVVVELELTALQRLAQELLGLLADTLVGHVHRLAEVDLAVLVLGCLVEVDDLVLTPVEQSFGLGASGVHATLQRAAFVLLLGHVIDLAGLRTDLVSGVAHTAEACVGVGAGSDERASTDHAAEGFVQAVGGVLGNVAVGVEVAERVAAGLTLCQFGPAFAEHAERRLGCRAHTLDTSAQRAAGQLVTDDAREDGVHRAGHTADDVRRAVQVLG